MGTVVEATMPTDTFALDETFERVPDAEVETVRVVAHGTGRVMPYLWASAADPAAIYEALQSDPTTERVQRLTRGDERDLFRVEWRPDVRAVVYLLVEEQGTLLGASGRDGQWTFRLLFLDHDAVSATHDVCREYGVDICIRRVKGLTDAIDRNGIELSEKQHEALAAAFETDYYGVPRGMTLEELAGEVGVSHQALSERLRRGHQALISNALFGSSDGVESDP